jgi:heme/copper-type cytochrome/quinol oxidase subunit 3
MNSTANIDVSRLATIGEGPRSSIWWGNLGMVTIESTVFALVIASYFYLRTRAHAWPPQGIPDPSLALPTWNLLLMLASCVPMAWIDTHAKNEKARELRILMVLITLIMVPILYLRYREFGALGTNWSEHSYGSLIWTMMGLHTGHLVASFLEDAVLTFYAFKRPLDEKHRLDLSINSFYWFFVVGSWVFLYAVIFWAPRII